MTDPLRITVWDEFRQKTPEVLAVYPHGVGAAVTDGFNRQPGCSARTVHLDEPEQGLPEEVLNRTEVLVWWGHLAHKEVSDTLTLKVQKRVLEGMGLIVLHSACWAKPFVRLMGTTCQLNYRMAVEREVLWNVAPGHPITQGVGDFVVLPREEVYIEYFDVPPPEELVFISSYAGGEAFRSGCCWRRGAGRIFYFRPGHETCPTYHHPEVQRVLANAVRWAAPRGAMRFESGPRPAGWLEKPQQKPQAFIIGGSHPLAEVLDPAVYKR